MFLRFFRSTGAQVLIIILLLSLFLWLPSFFRVTGSIFFFDKVQMPFYRFFTDLMSYDSIVGKLLTFLLILFQSFLLVRMNTKYIFINNRTYLPSLFFILLTAAIPDLQRLNPVIFANLFLILALEKIFDSYKTNRLAYEIFTASIFLAVATLFYPYMIYFVLILWISLAMLKPFRWREWMFTILGFLTPFYFVFSYYYIFLNQPGRLLNDFSAVFMHSYPEMAYSLPEIIFGGFILLMILLSSQFMLKTYATKKILPRKAYGIFLWLFIISVIVYILDHNVSAEIIFIVAVPLSFLLSHYFALIKSEFWGNIFMLILFILLGIIQVYGTLY